MSKIIKCAAAIGAAVAIGAGGLAMTAPDASAKTIKKHGTINKAEASKVHKQMLRQNCLTRHETKKIVGARGTSYRDGIYSEIIFMGSKKSRVISAMVSFERGCAYQIDVFKEGSLS